MNSLHLLAQAVTTTTPTANPDAGHELTTGGWLVMVTAVGGVTLLLLWCIRRVLRETPGKVHSPVDIEPPDERADRQAHGH